MDSMSAENLVVDSLFYGVVVIICCCRLSCCIGRGRDGGGGGGWIGGVGSGDRGAAGSVLLGP